MHGVGASQEHVVSVSPAHVDTPAVSGLTGACGRSKYCACHEIQPQICALAGCFTSVCVLFFLARGRSFSSVGARSGLGLTGARERSKSLKKARLPRNPAARPTRNLVSTALLQVASQACACQFSARAQLLERRRTQRLGSDHVSPPSHSK